MNPKELKPEPSLEPSPVGLQVFDELLIQTTPGPWGPGVFVHQTTSLKIDQFIDWRGTNCAVIHRKPGSTLLIAGNEDGQIGLYDINSKPALILDRINLRVKTNNPNPEDIEVRALWADDHDDFVFAASTWGNDQTRRPELPSFFVLNLVTQSEILS